MDVKKPEEQKKEDAEQQRNAADTGDNENEEGGEMKKIRTFDTKWLMGCVLRKKMLRKHDQIAD